MDAAWRERLRHPLTATACACVATYAFAGLVACVLKEPQRSLQLYYAVPIGVPFVFFLFDRAVYFLDENVSLRRAKRRICVVDVLVVVLALGRLATLALPWSGHALFLAYALGTVRSWPARAAALAVGVQVVHFKLAILPDAAVWPGLAMGAFAALLYRVTARASPRAPVGD